jgi:tyrosine phenol-lyase
MNLPFCESYKIKTIEPLYKSTLKQREKWLKEAKFNLFNLSSEQVFIDLLTDSGTGAMSDKQWAEIMTGDESYAGSRSYYKLKEAIEEIFGFSYFLPTHQGRAAENVLFSALIKAGDIIPGNAHFDTTKGHIEFRKAIAVDCTIDEATDTDLQHPFKGNVDIGKLEKILKSTSCESIPLIILTITCNTTGGQPVSMQNMRDVHALSKKYGVPLFFDAARFAENAWFIREREDEFRGKPIGEIVKKMFSYADGMTMSSKKDGIVNIGGFIGFRDKELFRTATTFNIMFEGFITYGGMAGRDMAALAQGLREVIEVDYLQTRIRQVEFLGEKLVASGVPIQHPVGGHAVFIDALKFLPDVKREEFVAQTLALEIYLEAGIRAVEIGPLMADRDPVSRENRFPQTEMVRLAIPRRVYTNSHMEYVAAAVKNVFDRRQSIKSGYKIAWEAEILRHFTIELEKI